ncbi:glycoside hydrolase superfamily [Rhodofomes roseus]|uniref:Glycoside hydrolase superfamily n=1 Tax=Rhodofomes roseus TaxID=34475 RepID=A0ABQ8KSD1_9APHY|nr:glycoside hydrolase superfamily [Rhodofomes roseus]KAH9841366.1 glycoside hydrolase superfamily [Rhodofomes roseus]
MYFSAITSVLVLAVSPIAAQQIYDIWSTQWDRSTLFTYTNLGPNGELNFTSDSKSNSATISVDDSTLYQDMVGFGATLTDSSAKLLSELKSSNSDNYWSILNYLFDPTDGADAAGFSYIRVPIGASDFSDTAYSLDDTSGDTNLDDFNINAAPSYLYDTLSDIAGINRYLKIHIVPWSPPAWMKDSGSLLGGNFLSSYTDTYASYLLKALQGYQGKGFNVWAIGIQNEPENSDSTYPTCSISASQEADIGTQLRTLMNDNGFSSTVIIGYEHNWNDAGAYPVTLMQDAPNAFSGASFHCYSGSVSDQQTFESAYPDKAVYFTECTGEYGSDWWSDIKWSMDNIFIGAPNYWAQTGAMWNLALDGNGQPILSGSDSCGTPCRPVVTINSDGTFSYNQEFYAIAQAQKAINPKDVGGPVGQRISSTVGGDLSWALLATAYVTNRNSASDWPRYSLVVLNWDDSASTTWNPQPVTATIEFRGNSVSYTFPVGVTTLWWYGSPN